MLEYCLMCDAEAKYLRYTQFAGTHPLCDTHAREDSEFLVDNSYVCWEVL